MKIIFLNGMGQSASAWDKVVKELPERDVETLDLFDNGQFPETYHLLETKVRQLLNSIDEEFILVGLSLGACLAFSSLKDRPKNLKGIIACAGQFNLKGNLAFAMQKQVFKMIPKSFFAKQGVNKEKLIEFLSSMSDLNLTDNLIQSEIPALVTCGQKDRFNIKTSQEAASLMPNACFREIPNAGHLLTEDAPQTLANLIEEFLEKISNKEKKMSENIYDITIVGGGPVGLWAAFYAGLRGMKVKIIESLSELGGQPAILYPEKMVYDIPAYPAIPAGQLVDNLIEQLKRFEDRTTICLKEEVKTFEKVDGVFTIETNKAQHFSKAIVIACGNGAFAPRPLGLEGEEDYADNNLFYNVHKLDQFAGQNVVICGGGDSAVDWALHLEEIAASVTLVHRRDAFRAHEHSVELLKESGVKIMTPYVPLSLSGENGRATSLSVQKVKSDEVEDLPLDSLIVSFGFSTSNKNLKNWNVDYKRSSINVSPLFETSQEGVYAIGDAADYEGKVDLIATGFGEAPTAINQAIKYIYPERDNRVVHSTSLIQD